MTVPRFVPLMFNKVSTISPRAKEGLSECRSRAEIFPIILSQSSATQDHASDDEEDESNQQHIIRIGEWLFATAA